MKHLIATGFFGAAMIGAMFAHWEASAVFFGIIFTLAACSVVT